MFNNKRAVVLVCVRSKVVQVSYSVLFLQLNSLTDISLEMDCRKIIGIMIGNVLHVLCMYCFILIL